MTGIYINFLEKETEEFKKLQQDIPNRTNERNKELVRNILSKQLEFIRLHSSNKQEQYYSFQLFKNQIAVNFLVEPDTLLHFYEEYFSETLKNSYEGKIVTDLISKRQMANVRGIQKIEAPLFSTTDIFGENISLKNNLGNKLTLINFWASWCGNCLAEFPAIKKIQQKYPPQQLEIIASELR